MSSESKESQVLLQKIRKNLCPTNIYSSYSGYIHLRWYSITNSSHCAKNGKGGRWHQYFLLYQKMIPSKKKIKSKFSHVFSTCLLRAGRKKPNMASGDNQKVYSILSNFLSCHNVWIRSFSLNYRRVVVQPLPGPYLLWTQPAGFSWWSSPFALDNQTVFYFI